MALRAGVIGGSGYVGGELVRILLNHPHVEIGYVSSREYASKYIHTAHPNLKGVTAITFSKPSLEAAIKSSDVIFTCVPHGTAVEIVPKFLERGVRVLDLSADFRLKDPSAYERWYSFSHPTPELLKEAVYGIPELHREEMRKAKLVAVAGCMSTSAIVALAPPVKANFVDMDHIVIDAKIASSGAGSKPSPSNMFSERYNVIRPYKAVGHRHIAEVEQELASLAGREVKVAFTPHAVNQVRGILSTIHAFLSKEITEQDMWKAYRGFYSKEPFIRYMSDRQGKGKYPDPKFTVGSNFVDIGFRLDRNVNRAVIFSSIDNLIKGASGQAVQCMNVMAGFDETEGLLHPAIHPI